MAEVQPSLITVRSPHLAVEIDPNGAQLHSLRDPAGRDYLWHGDPKFWAGRAPLLFPIIGTLNGGKFRVRGHEYALTRHGFARGSLFEVIATTPSSAVCRLRSSASTLALYPFAFELEVRYEIVGPTLSVQATVRNTGAGKMPASLGFHPGFAWPLPSGEPRAAHFVGFEKEEPAPIRRIDAAGLLSPQSHPTPIVNRRLLLADTLFHDDVVILDTLNSRRVSYGTENGPRIEIDFPDASYLGIWTKPGAPFVCIEPWQGVTDPAGFDGDLFEKPGVFIVHPGATHSFGMTISLRS